MATTRLQTLEDATRERTIKRLKIIEGQVRGVQGMVQEGRKCVDILMQVAAVQEGTPQRGQAGDAQLPRELRHARHPR